MTDARQRYGLRIMAWIQSRCRIMAVASHQRTTKAWVRFVGQNPQMMLKEGRSYSKN